MTIETPQDALAILISGRALSAGEMERLMDWLLDGEVPAALQAALLAALATKGETAAEIGGAARALRARIRPVPHRVAGVVDTCGTGGDGRGTFNISTAAAMVAAAAGVPVAKHGNRSVSSKSGSADVLEALGVPVVVEPEAAAVQLESLGLCFLFAPSYHPAIREVMPVRRELGVRTLFNVLGPLLNPAGAKRQLVGVYARELVEIVADALLALGAEHALVVHGEDGLDEITTAAETFAAEVRPSGVATRRLTPEDLGLERVAPEALRGGEPGDNAEAMAAVMAGAPGPLREVTAANAGAALYVGGRAESIAAGVALAFETIDGGEARTLLDRLRAGR